MEKPVDSIAPGKKVWYDTTCDLNGNARLSLKTMFRCVG